VGPSIVNPGAKSTIVGQSVSVQITASDPENDVLTYSASGLPSGLSINSSTGRITGAPTTVGTRTVAVTVSDGLATASTSFAFTVLADTIAPTTPGTPAATTQNGKPYLTWSASTDNVGVTGYIIYRSSTASVPGTEAGRSATTSFRDTDAQRSRIYYYAVEAYDAAGNRSGRSAVTVYSSK
jgi:hypothetical protein